MSNTDELHQRRLAREISARQQAETLLEQKSLELYIEAQERQSVLQKLQESEERYRLIVEMSPDAIMVELDGRLAFANSAARRMFAEHSQRTLVGLTMNDLGLESDVARATEEPGERIETIATRIDGSRFEIALRCLPMTYDGKQAMQVVARDISDRKRLEKELAHQAAHDSLTGVSNRRALIASLSETLAFARRHDLQFWVVFIDLDHFKQINDRFGHRAGDRLLETITARLRQLLRQDDIIGRYGGDEFVLLLRSGPESRLSTPILERIMQVVCEPVDFDGHQLAVTCSLGVTAYPEDGDHEDVLIERADAAMYIAKSSGRNLYQLYNTDIQQQHTERSQIQKALTDALQQHQLSLAYQAQINFATGEIIGIETFLRWQHPTLGTLKPSRFLPIAEESNLINQIGDWVIHTACKECSALRQQGFSGLTVSVNLSGKQLHAPQLLETIDRALTGFALPATALVLELNEKMIMADIESSISALSALNTLGVKIAIDNFGTGFSSFTQLLRLPISALKIDRRLVAAIHTVEGRQSQVVAKALIQLAHGLDMSVIAEGVETIQQFSILRESNCDVLQGWIHSPALPIEETVALLRDHDPKVWLRKVQS
ncbi:MAG: EAL domain-containing protein [Oxalobacteraceae bacterium]|nr:EAL domain-containing protein [Oxalobacteraceae bacterium]